MGTDLSQAPSLAQGGGFSPVDGDRLLLAGLAGPQETPARPVRRASVQNVRMWHVFDRLGGLAVRLACLVRLIDLISFIGLVGVRGTGLEIGRSVR